MIYFYLWLTSFLLCCIFCFTCCSFTILISCLANTSCNLLILLIVAVFSFCIIFLRMLFYWMVLFSLPTFKLFSLYFVLSELCSARVSLYLWNLSYRSRLLLSMDIAVSFTFSRLWVMASSRHLCLSAYMMLTRSFACWRCWTFLLRMLFLFSLFRCNLWSIFCWHRSSISSSFFLLRSLRSRTCWCLRPLI